MWFTGMPHRPLAAPRSPRVPRWPRSSAACATMSSARRPGEPPARNGQAPAGVSAGPAAVYGETIRSASPVGGMVRAARSGHDLAIGHAPARPQGPTALRLVLVNQLRQLRDAI